MTEAAPPVVVLDACVLVPTATREILFEIARRGAFRPRWSAQIEAEWRAAAAKRGGAVEAAFAEGDMALARSRFPEGVVEGWETVAETLSLPDWNDRHVLAAAIVAEANLLVTDNLRDFPRRTLAAHGIAREAADPFLWRLVGDAPAAVSAALEAYAAAAPADLLSDGLSAHFKKARLPRFAKAIARL